VIGYVEGSGIEVRPISLARGGFPNGLTRGPDDPSLAFVATNGGDHKKWGDSSEGYVTLFVREKPEPGTEWKALRAAVGPGRFNSIAVGDFNGDGYDDFAVAREGGDREDRGVYVFLQTSMK
jgi:hypothetical protein